MPEAARRNPDWEWDETVLACDLVAQNAWQPLAPEDQRIVELSYCRSRQRSPCPVGVAVMIVRDWGRYLA